MKIRAFLIRLFVLLSSFFVTFGIIEVYFRIFDPQPIRPAMYKTDPIYGLRMVPGLKGYLKEAEFTQPFQLNSLGFREKEYNKRKSEGSYRIIGIGDSFTWGAGVSQSDTFIKRLERALNSDFNEVNYEVFNWGVSAWGTAQEFLCLEHQALAYQPDLVILQYYTGNDMADNIYSSIFRLDQEANLKRSDYGRQKIIHIKKITDYVPFYRFLTQHSHFMNFIRLRLLAKVEKSDMQQVAVTIPQDQEKYGLRLTEAILEAFFSLASKNGIKVAVLVIPEKNKAFLASSGAKTAQQQRFFNESRMLTNVCRRHNVPLLNFLNIFLQRNTSLIYYEKDTHLSPYGHQIVAESLEKFLKKHHLL